MNNLWDGLKLTSRGLVVLTSIFSLALTNAFDQRPIAQLFVLFYKFTEPRILGIKYMCGVYVERGRRKDPQPNLPFMFFVEVLLRQMTVNNSGSMGGMFSIYIFLMTCFMFHKVSCSIIFYWVILDKSSNRSIHPMSMETLTLLAFTRNRKEKKRFGRKRWNWNFLGKKGRQYSPTTESTMVVLC